MAIFTKGVVREFANRIGTDAEHMANVPGIKPTNDDIGRAVIYTGNRYPGDKTEEGIITFFNKTTIFVRYGADKNAKGTSPADLEWMTRR